MSWHSSNPVSIWEIWVALLLSVLRHWLVDKSTGKSVLVQPAESYDGGGL